MRQHAHHKIISSISFDFHPGKSDSSPYSKSSRTVAIARSQIWRGSHLLRMVDDLGDLLGVSLEYAYHLFRVLVEDGAVAVAAGRDDLAGVLLVDVQ